ncbi:hypothetical protein V1525DRAFT_395709 [Lipomyces kononenkoae]|uniref:Uncharacterized protein n=1 Tax=Lipomyces kononenkoae TaxID=34357 RepID=A0ACC3T9K1_LIPKO
MSRSPCAGQNLWSLPQTSKNRLIYSLKEQAELYTRRIDKAGIEHHIPPCKTRIYINAMCRRTDLAKSDSDSSPTTTLEGLLALKSQTGTILSDLEVDVIQDSALASKTVVRAAEELAKLEQALQLDQSAQAVSLAIRRDIAKIHAIASHVSQFETDIDLMISIRQLHYRCRTRMAHKLIVPDPSVGTSFNRLGISKLSKMQLRNWVHQHGRFLYPTAEEERDLLIAIGISKRQLDCWLKMLRRRTLHSHISSDLQCIFGVATREDFSRKSQVASRDDGAEIPFCKEPEAS